MKTFIEEYGLVVVSIIVIMLIVVAATPIGTNLKDGIMTAIEKLTTALGTAVSVTGNPAQKAKCSEKENERENRMDRIDMGFPAHFTKENRSE